MADTTFAQALKNAREKAGLSQAALARRAGLTGSYVCVLEAQRKPPPSPKVIAALCAALGIEERPIQELAAVERAPAALKQRLERIDRERGRIHRTRDRLLTTSLYQLSRRVGGLDPMGEFGDLAPGPLGLLGRLVGRFRKAKSLKEAESESHALLGDATPRDRDMLVRILPGVLASRGEPGAPASTASPPTAPLVPVFTDLARTGEPREHLEVDARFTRPHAFLWRVSTDDGHPRVEAGDLVLLDPHAEAGEGDLVALREDGRDHVRFFHRQGGEVRLVAGRPDVPPLRRRPDEFRPVGIGIWLLRALR